MKKYRKKLYSDKFGLFVLYHAVSHIKIGKHIWNKNFFYITVRPLPPQIASAVNILKLAMK